MSVLNKLSSSQTYDPASRRGAITAGVLFLTATVTFTVGDTLIVNFFSAPAGAAATDTLAVGVALQALCATKRHASVPGPVLHVGQRKLSRYTCRDEVLAAMHSLVERTGEEVFTVACVFAEMGAAGTSYKLAAVYKTMQRMKDPDAVDGRTLLERHGRQGFRLATSEHAAPTTA